MDIHADRQVYFRHGFRFGKATNQDPADHDGQADPGKTYLF